MARIEHLQKIRQESRESWRDTFKIRMTDSRQIQAVAIVLLLVTQHCCALPYSGSTGNDIDIDGNYQGGTAGGGGSGAAGGRPVDYHTVIGHFKDFFMYLPVMMTTLKETMSGFPKFAEGMRILSGKGRVDGEDCKCSQNNLPTGTSTEVLDNSSRFG